MRRFLDRVARNPRHAAVCALVVNLLLFAGALSCLSLCYESNDDSAMMRTANGTQTGEPSAYLTLTNIVIGLVLKQLYLIWGGFNWYTAYLLAVHLLSMSAVLFMLLRRAGGVPGICLHTLLFLLFEVRLLLELQFTSTAIMAGAVGLLTLFYGDDVESKPSWTTSLLGGTLIILSAMIRIHALSYAMLLAMPIFVAECGRYTNSRLAWRIAASMVIAAGMIGLHQAAYAYDREWREYQSYNSVRGALHDFSQLDYSGASPFFFDRLGWSRNDYFMFRHWFFADEELFAREKLEALTRRFSGGGGTRYGWKNYLRNYLDQEKWYLPLTASFFVLGLLVGQGNRLRLMVLAMMGTALICVLTVLLARYAKLVDRVIIPPVFLINLTILLLGLSRIHQVNRGHSPLAKSMLPVFQWVIGGIAAVSLAWSAYSVTRSHYDRCLTNRTHHLAYERLVPEVVQDLSLADRRSVLVVWGGTFPHFWMSPFAHHEKLRDMPIVGLGWMLQSPHHKQLLKQLQIEDIHRALYRDPHVYLVCNQADTGIFGDFVHEHYGDHITFAKSRYYVYEHAPALQNSGRTLAGQRVIQIRKPLLDDSTTLNPMAPTDSNARP